MYLTLEILPDHAFFMKLCLKISIYSEHCQRKNVKGKEVITEDVEGMTVRFSCSFFSFCL